MEYSSEAYKTNRFITNKSLSNKPITYTQNNNLAYLMRSYYIVS